MLADDDEVLRWIHGKISNRERQLMRHCRDRWGIEIRVVRGRQGYEAYRNRLLGASA
jgi:hypothetical protein